MGLFIESSALEVGLAAVAALAALYWFLVAPLDYWRRRGVPYVPALPIFGNLLDTALMRCSQGEIIERLYRKLDGHRYGGIFQFRSPTLLVRDPDIIRTVMVKDFTHFQDRGLPTNQNSPLSQNLFSVSGPIWRLLRNKLSPTFTSGKMKMMFHAIEECSQQLRKYLAPHAAKKDILELKDILGKFSTDIIGTCAFGLQMNAMQSEDSEFRKMGKKVFEASSSKLMKRIVILLFPALSKLLGIQGLAKDVEDFFMNAVKETVQYREKNNIQRNDFLQLLIRLKNKEKIEDDENHSKLNGVKKETDQELEMDDGLLAAQCFIFFLAGFETSSTTMSFALHELAVNPEMQTKLREEIDATLAQCGGEITYEGVMGMKYMDQVVSEALRKYPPVSVLRREVTTPYTLPDTNIKLDKGLQVIIPVYGLHHDPKYFPRPDRFEPERFNEEEKSKRPNYVYLPFGEGPRNCIGLRFGLLQTKMGLLALLSDYEFHVCERTAVPLKLDPRSAVTASTTGTILRITERT